MYKWLSGHVLGGARSEAHVRRFVEVTLAAKGGSGSFMPRSHGDSGSDSDSDTDVDGEKGSGSDSE